MKSGRRAVYSSAPCFLLRSGSHHLYSSFPNDVSLKNGVNTNSNFTPTNLKISSANISILGFRSLYLSGLTMCPEGYWSHQMSHLSLGTRAWLFTASSQSGEKILFGPTSYSVRTSCTEAVQNLFSSWSSSSCGGRDSCNMAWRTKSPGNGTASRLRAVQWVKEPENCTDSRAWSLVESARSSIVALWECNAGLKSISDGGSLGAG